jgi:hypothetical protein
LLWHHFFPDKTVLVDVIDAAKLLKEERKLTTKNLALVLVHDLLLTSGGIQAGDGPVKQAVLRHKTRLNSEFQRIKIKLGVKTTQDLARSQDERAGQSSISFSLQSGDGLQSNDFSKNSTVRPHQYHLLEYRGRHSHV